MLFSLASTSNSLQSLGHMGRLGQGAQKQGVPHHDAINQKGMQGHLLNQWRVSLRPGGTKFRYLIKCHHYQIKMPRTPTLAQSAGCTPMYEQLFMLLT